MGGKVIFKKGTEKYWKEASLSKSNGMVETVEEGLKLERGSREMEARLASPRFASGSRRVFSRNRIGWGCSFASSFALMEGDVVVLSPQSQPAWAYRQFATSPKASRQAWTVKHSWSSSTMNGTRGGEDGETDDFLKFLRIFDETPSSASFFEYIPFNRSTEREIINPFVPSYYTLFSNTRKYWEIRYSFRFETQLYNNNNTLSQNPFKQIAPRLDYYVAISFSLINSLQHFVKPSSNYPPCPNLSPRSLYRSRPSLDPPNQFAAPWLLNPRPNRRCSLL